MARLSQEWKKKIPKGNFREVQKQLNYFLKQISVAQEWFYDHWSGYTENQFEYNLRVFKNCCVIRIHLKIMPPLTLKDFEKLYYSLKRYVRNDIYFKLTFRKAYGGKPAFYNLRFAPIKISLKGVKKPKKKTTYSQARKGIDRLLDDHNNH